MLECHYLPAALWTVTASGAQDIITLSCVLGRRRPASIPFLHSGLLLCSLRAQAHLSNWLALPPWLPPSLYTADSPSSSLSIPKLRCGIRTHDLMLAQGRLSTLRSVMVERPSSSSWVLKSLPSRSKHGRFIIVGVGSSALATPCCFTSKSLVTSHTREVGVCWSTLAATVASLYTAGEVGVRSSTLATLRFTILL